MFLDSESAEHLKPWLVRTLEPICDAEPGALADYILALLKHNVSESELRKDMQAQLDEFLEKECLPFLDTLFTALRTKSYLPYAATSPSTSSTQQNNTMDTGIPIPLDSLLSPASPGRGRKRSLEIDDRDPRGPPKGPRTSGDGQFSRYGQGRGGSNGGWNGRGQMNGGNGQRNGAYVPPNRARGICRDYHNTGYCARGALCKYSHGDDAIVPGQMFPPNGMPFMPMFANGFGMPGGPMAAYDPNESRMDMRGMGNGRFPQRPPVLPRMQRDDGSHSVQHYQRSGELPVIQDLTPNVHPNDLQPHPDFQRRQENGAPYSPQPQEDVEMSGPAPRPQAQGRPYNGRQNLRGARGNGVFNGEAPNFQPQRPERRKDKTLVIEKIPEDKLSLDQINDWFKRFGTVTNVAIDRSTSKALISFADHQEAYTAWKSEDAVFNNRFVKVFWHRPMEGQGGAGSRLLAASAPVVANLGGKEATSTSSSPKPTPTPSTPSRKPPAPGSSAAALAAKQQLLEQQIAEQKLLMASLSSASPEEKKNIMARLRELSKEMTATPSAPATEAPPSTTPNAEQQEKDRLDKELEMQVDGDGGESAEELKAKLERLKAEAASLGISDTGADALYGSSYRGGYRGRGRGRGYYRGAIRGGPPRASMKLDNRPKKLQIRGVDSEHIQALQDWYETTGQVESISTEDDGSVIVAFKSRPAAEQGLAKGTNIPLIGQIQVSWYGSTQTTSTTRPASTSQREDSSKAEESRSPEPDRLPSPRMEDEVVASGWGGDDDGM